MARLAVSNYFEAALSIIGEGDVDGLTLDALCQRLGVTKGSFYHHFSSRRDFIEQLVNHWRVAHGLDIVRAARAIDDPVDRLRSFRDLSLQLPHSAERTLRVSGGRDPLFAEAVAAVDEARRSIVSDTLEELGIDSATAHELAYASVAMLVGLQDLRDDERDRILPLSLMHLQAMLTSMLDRHAPS